MFDTLLQPLKEEIARLENRLKKTQAELLSKDSLPYKTGGITILAVNLLEQRLFYDTKWQVVVEDEGGLKKTTVTRKDTQSFEGLLQELELCNSLEEVKALDERNKIYYD